MIAGDGFQIGATVTFGGGLAVSVTFEGASQILAVTPPHAAGAVDVMVQNLDGSSGTLAGGFSYEPAPTIPAYFSLAFDDDSIGNFFPYGDPEPEITTDYSHSGTESLKCVIDQTGSGASGVYFYWGADYPPFYSGAFSANPALTNANGLYQRWYILFPQSTLDNVVNNNDPECSTGYPICGQVKTLINRGFDADSNTAGGWLILGTGPEFPVTPGTLGNGEDTEIDETRSWDTGVVLQADTWYEVETWFKRDDSISKGRAKMWVNGHLVTDTGWLAGLGWDDLDIVQSLWLGAVYAQNQTGPITVYVDDVAAADGWIEPAD